MLTDKERRLAREAANAIEEGVSWDDTPQGHEYWYEVSANLRALATPPKLECWANVHTDGDKFFHKHKDGAIAAAKTGKPEWYSHIAVHMKEV